MKSENNLKLTKAVIARAAGLSGYYELKENPHSSVNSQQSSELNFLTGDCRLPTIDCFKQTASSERAELKAIDLQRRITGEQVRYARGAYWPTLSIEGVYSRKDENPSSAFLNKESIYGGLKLNFPFFEGGLRKAEVGEAEAKKRQAELVYEDAIKTINIEVENAYLDMITQKGILKSLQDRVAFAADNYNSIFKQYQFGLAHSIDVIDANTLLITSERQFVDANYNYQLSVLRLKRVTGTLLKAVTSHRSSVIGQNREEK